MTFSRGDTLRLKSDDVVWREVEDELVVLELATTTYLTLNGSARQLWLGLADGASVDVLAKLLVDQYGIPLEQATADAESFVAEMTDRGLVESAG
jgi:hypothetical protein